MYLQITRYELTKSTCKRDTKSKSHPGMKLAPVRVFSCNYPLNISLFTETGKKLSYVYVWLDSILPELEIPTELCFIKASVALSLFFCGTRPLTSGKINMRDCFVLRLISYGKTLWKIQKFKRRSCDKDQDVLKKVFWVSQ